MRHVRRPGLIRSALLASAAMLLFGSPAMAQSVQIFDAAPSIDQLRSIMIPESQPGMGRSIVMQHADVGGGSTAVQQVAAHVAPAARTRVDAAALPNTPVVQEAAAVSPAPMMPKPKQEHAEEPSAVGFRVNFAFNSVVLPNSAYAMIDLIAQLMKEAPDLKVRVEGHTDATGSFDYNKTLSERRALSVAEYLVRQGVEPARLILAGKGPTEPLTPNRFDAANRRVQFVRVS